MPVIEMFISAYVMRKSDDPKTVVTYQLAVYTAVPVSFLVNGWLLRWISIKRLYSVGMLLSGVSMVIMMNLGELSLGGLAAAGLLMGVASSLYWANRDFLVLSYYGLENFFATNMNILVPLLVSETRVIDFRAMDHEPSWLNEVGFVFNKHYFGAKLGEMRDGTEEFECAVAYLVPASGIGAKDKG